MVAVDSVGGLLASDANKVDFKSTFVQEKVSVAQKKQDGQVSAALQRLDVLEASSAVLPQIQSQLESIKQQTQALEEATRQLREQEAQLSSQAARLTLLEKQVDDRLTSLEGKVARIETSEEQHYSEVKAALVSIREGNERAAEVQAQEDVHLCHTLAAYLDVFATMCSIATPSDQVKKVKENFLDKSTYGFYGSPTGNWEADLVADEQPDDQSLDAKTDRALSRNQAQGQWATLHDETAVFHGFAERSLQAKKVAEKKYQEIQEKELKFREKMVKALSLAKKYRGEIASLETKKRFQDEAIKWVQDPEQG
eukprot:g18921.t1